MTTGEEEEDREGEKCAFLRSDLRGEVKGNKVEYLACSTEKKKVFRCGILWNWNRHVQLKHAPKSPDASNSGSGIGSNLGSSRTQSGKSLEQAAKLPQQVASGKQPKLPKKRAQPAAMPAAHVVLRLPAKAAKHDNCNDSSTVGLKQDPPRSTDSATNEMIPKSAAKKLGSAEFRKACAVPSTKSASKEQQAGMRADLDSVFSNPTCPQKSSINDFSTSDSPTFSHKNANISK